MLVLGVDHPVLIWDADRVISNMCKPSLLFMYILTDKASRIFEKNNHTMIFINPGNIHSLLQLFRWKNKRKVN